jgi:hypothetical protein
MLYLLFIIWSSPNLLRVQLQVLKNQNQHNIAPHNEIIWRSAPVAIATGVGKPSFSASHMRRVSLFLPARSQSRLLNKRQCHLSHHHQQQRAVPLLGLLECVRTALMIMTPSRAERPSDTMRAKTAPTA